MKLGEIKVAMQFRVDWDTYFIAMALLAATRATCPRLSVGAVLVKDKRVVSTGYNGAPPGQPHCMDVGCLMIDNHCKRTIHAETNALLYATPEDRAGSTMYVTHTPCYECARTIAGSGIKRVVYSEEYRPDRILELFEPVGIELVQHASD